jgi:hypothetical protein
MKTKPIKYALAALALLSTLNSQLSTSVAATTITTTNRYAYGANVGWVDACADTNNGAVVGEFYCSGYLYAANVGWINLGDGTPLNGIGYLNDRNSDFGVNVDSQGRLRGYAWGANIGWINFESTGNPVVSLATGKFSGYAWSANCGWISLTNASAVVQTGPMAAAPDTDGDGIADPWERMRFGNLVTADATTDWDKDGMTDGQEYLAGTDPKDTNDVFAVVSFTRNTPYASYNHLTWKSSLSRCYQIETRSALDPASPWAPYTTGNENKLGWSEQYFYDYNARQFYRVRAVRPLMP